MSEAMRAMAQARHATWRRLRELYPDDFDRIYQEERAARGIPERTPANELEYLRQRVRDLTAERE